MSWITDLKKNKKLWRGFRAARDSYLNAQTGGAWGGGMGTGFGFGVGGYDDTPERSGQSGDENGQSVPSKPLPIFMIVGVGALAFMLMKGKMRR